MGADTGRETVVTRQREEQEAAKPRRALRWAQQAGLQGADSHQQSAASAQREPTQWGDAREPFSRVAIPQYRGPVLWNSTKEIEMRSSRSSFLAAVAAMAAMSAAGAAEVVRDASSQALMPPRAAEKVSGTANRRAPGAHKAAHRAAMKLRRVKKHKARCK